MSREKPYIHQTRMPRSLEKRVRECADKEGVSINQYILYVLTVAVAENRGAEE